MADQRYYVLEGREVKPVDDVRVWGEFFNDNDARRVGYDECGEGTRVSTVFLGINHNWSDKGPPLLFETMIFGGKHDESTWRYSTYDRAEAGHRAIVDALKAGKAPGHEEAMS